MVNLAEAFPATSKYTYINTPGIGLISEAVKNYRSQYYGDLWEGASRFHQESMVVLPKTREKIASFFNGQPEFVALVPAFSFGFNATLEGLKATSKVLLLQGDYPSINYAVEARDFQISYAAIDAHLEKNVYDAFKKEQPDVFIFSIVQYLNGIKMDLQFIETLKAEFPETIFIADGTQYLGMETFDFAASGIDILGASAYKWLNAGFGNGFFMLRPEMEGGVHPKYLGFGSDLGKYKERGDTLIGKFEGNHLDFSNIGSMKVALDFQEEVGLSHIENRIKELTAAAKESFENMGLLEGAVTDRMDHSPIFNLKGDDALFQKLNDRHILTSQRGKGIRVGFHYYNTLDDLENLLDALK